MPHAERFTATNEQYHARGEVSHSTLDEFLEDPATFHATRITKELPPREPTEEMKFGSLVHAWVLERETVVEIPADALTSNGAKNGTKWRQFAETHAGLTLVKKDEAEVLLGIERAIRSHEKAGLILYSEIPAEDREANILWVDQETGLSCRCRLDAIHPNLLGDLKTAAAISPRKFADSCLYYGYHRQAAWYQDGFRELGGELRPFVFVPVTKKRPYQAATYEMDDEFIELGRQENRRALRRLAECHDMGVWQQPGWGHILKLKAPYGAKFRNQWEV